MQVAERNDRSAAAYLLRILFIKPWASQLTNIPPYAKEESPRLKPPFLVREKQNRQRTDDVFEEAKADILRGGWKLADDAHWKFLSDLVRRLDKPATVTLISCPLAPKSPAEITYRLLSTLYHELSSDGAFEQEYVSLAGDSSGGNIALSLVMQCISQGLPAPTSLILISPSVDLSHRHSGLEEASLRDPLESLHLVKETAKAWAQDLQETDPRLSPALGEITVLRDRKVKVFGIIAGDDVLSVEAEEFVDHCREIGIEGRWLFWKHQLHDFPIMSPYKIPESVKAVEWIALALNEGMENSNLTHKRFEELESKPLKPFLKHVIAARPFK